MDWSTVVLLIVFMAVGMPMLVGALKVWTSRPQGSAETDATVHSLEQEVAALRERVTTLEAIVTDDGYRLTQEFDKLETTTPEAERVESR